MANTFYLDLEAGVDNNSGDSFAVTANGVDGVTNGTSAFTSVTGTFTSALIGRLINIVTKGLYSITAVPSGTSLTLAIIPSGTALPSVGAALTYNIGGRVLTQTTGLAAVRTQPGDTVRVMGSPAPTSLGQSGTWTNAPLQATQAITSSTNATPIVITKNGHGLSTGDRVSVISHTTNTAANGNWFITKIDANTFSLDTSVGNGVGGATGTFKLINSCIVKLTTAVTAHIDKCQAVWTQSTNVVTTVGTTTYKIDVGCASIAIAGGFATGLAAFKATGTIDLSAYKQVSFWIRNDVAIPASSLSIRLCTNADGTGSVHTITVPAIPSVNQWVPITVDTGGALNSAIKSVALYVDVDYGATTILLNNIIACKDSTSANSLTLQSLIGKNTTNESWWGIASIDGTAVTLDATTNTIANAGRGYAGTTETVTTYKRETIKTTMATSSSGLVFLPPEAGTALATMIYYEGGWDRTNMSTQTIETWVDGLNGLGNCWTQVSYTSLNLFGFVRYNSGITSATNSFASYGTIYVINGTFSGMSLASVSARVHFITKLIASSNGGVGLNSTCSGPLWVGNVICLSNLNVGINVTCPRAIYRAMTIKNNSGNGINFGALTQENTIYNLVSENNTTATGTSPSATNSTNGGTLWLKDCSIGEATIATALLGDARIISINHNLVSGDTRIYRDGGTIFSNTATRHTASGVSWAMAVTSATREALYPLDYVIAAVAVNANALVTVTCWLRRDSTNITGILAVRGGQLAGVAADVTDTMTAGANTWDQRTITFTPTEAGTIEIEVWAYGGTTNTLYVDDISVTQA